MSNYITISVAKDFSIYPAGRFLEDGLNSGERFRNDHLIPALQTGCDVVVDLDGTRGFGSSWLEEVFGGLVREGMADTLARLKVKAEDQSLVLEASEYMSSPCKAL